MRRRFATLKSGVRLAIRRLRGFPRKRGEGWHWPDHPEMQARIAEAEADRREGRVTRGSSWQELKTHLDSLK